MSTALSDNAVTNLRMVSKFFLVDLAALSDEQVMSPANGIARRPIDFGYEVVAVAERGLCVLKGEEPEGWDKLTRVNDWVVAPEDYCRTQLATDFERVHNAAADFLSGKTDEEMHATINTFFGPGPVFSVVNFLTLHANYHTAQLSYVAQLGGDLKNYWWSE